MPHMYDGGLFWGMHLLWWIFWVLLLVILFAVALPAFRRGTAVRPETALDVLQRRYAAGEISTEEYEERRARLTRDRQLEPD